MSAPVETLSGGKAWYSHPDGPMVLGEAPIYRASDSTLHWVDPLKEPSELYILKIDPESGDPIGNAKILVLEDSVSVMAFRNGKKGYICAYSQGVAFMDDETGKLEVVKEIIKKDERKGKRFNDGGVDAKGRFWLAEIDKLAMAYGAGKLPESYGKPKGTLWRYDPDGNLHKMTTGFICGNGVDWSPDNKTFYLNDSVGQKMFAFDFDLESGSISNKRTISDMSGSEGEPDGMVIDSEGVIWNSVYGTNKLMVFDPNGRHLKDILFSAKKLTCPTWGGSNFDMLFIASAKDIIDGDDEGGNMFRYRPGGGVKGGPKYVFAG